MSIYIRSISGQIGAASEVIASTTVDLANVKITTSIKNGMMAIIITDGSRFTWDSTSVASASSTVIVPNDGTSPGRWLSYKLNDTDISSTANISVSKLLAGPDGYILETVAGVPSWKPGGSAITLFGDVIGPGSSNTVIRLTGSSGIVNSGASILWDENISPILNIAQRIGNSAVKDFTISGQQPSSSSTSTNRNSGNIVLDIAAPYLDGYSGFVKIKQSGSQSVLIGKVPGTSNIGIYFGSSAPTTSNMSLSGDGYTYTQVNSSLGYSSLASGGVDYFAAGYSTSILDPSPGAFFSHLRQANLFHQGRQSDLTTNDFIITSQAPFATATTNVTPGNLIIDIPPQVSGTTSGYFNINLLGVRRFQFGLTPGFTPQNVAMIWMNNGLTPTSTNHILSSHQTNGVISINSYSSTAAINFTLAGLLVAKYRSDGLYFPDGYSTSSASTTYKIDHIVKTNDIVSQDFTIWSPAPFASAVTNLTPGNLILAVPAPVGAGAEGFVKVNVSSADVWKFGWRTNNLSHSFGVIYPGALTPSNTNYVFGYSAASTASGGAGTDFIVVNGPGTVLTRTDNPGVGTSGACVKVGLNNLGTARFYFDGMFFHWGDSTGTSITGYTIGQLTPITDVATVPFTIRSQAAYSSATLTNRNSGDLNIATPAPTSGGTAGSIFLKPSDTVALTLNYLGALRLNAYSTGILHSDASGNITSSTIVSSDITGPIAINKLAPGTDGYIIQTISSVPTWVSSSAISLTLSGDVTGASTANTVVNLSGAGGIVTSSATTVQFNTGITAPTIKQANNTTNSAMAQSLTIQAQNATGTTSTGGALVLVSGTGTTVSGDITFKTGSSTILSLSNDGYGQNIKFFNTFTFRSVTGANPTSPDSEGSLAIRYDAGSGSAWIRHNATWQELLRAATSSIPVSYLVTGTTNTVLWSNGTTNSFTGTPILSTSLQVGTSGAGNIGIGAAPTSNQLYINNIASPTDSQIRIMANGLGALTSTVAAADSILLGFDSEWAGSVHIARSTSASYLFKNAAALKFMGNTGLVVGNSYSPTVRMSLDLGTGALTISNLGLGVVHSSSGGVLTSSAIVASDITAGATNTVFWSNGTTNSFTATPIIATSLQVGTSGGGTIGIGGAPTTNKLYLNSATSPTVGQLLIQSNSLGAIGTYVVGADNEGITFDAEYISSAFTARNTSSVLIVKNSARLSIYGDSGLVAGNTFSPTARASFDPATGNWRLGDNTLGAQRLDVSGSTIISSKLAVGTSTLPPNGQVTIIGELFQNFTTGTNGGALRIASNSNQAFIGSNQYFNSTIKYNSTGGASTISFDTTTTSTAGSISFQTAPSGTVDTTATFTTQMTLTQSGLLRIGDSTVPTDQLELKGPNISWDKNAASPAIYQKDNTTNSATATSLTIQAQNATGTTSTGGALNLISGSGTTAPGSINFKAGSTNTLATWAWNAGNTQLSLGSTATGMSFFANTGTNQFMSFTVGGTTPVGLYFDADAINIRNGAGTFKGFWNNTGLRIGDAVGASDKLELASGNMSWANAASTPKIYQKDNTTNSATATSLTLQAQNATGTTATGGALVLTSGTGTTIAGNVSIQTGGTTIASVTPNKFITAKGIRRAVTSTTIAYQILVTDDIIAVGTLAAGINVTMPASPTTGDAYNIKDIAGTASTKNITVLGNGNNIDAASSYVMDQDYSSLTIVYTGAAWSVI